jgi:hypothetical protein
MQMQMPRAMNLTDVNFRELKQPRWLTTVFKTTFSRQSTFLQLETYKVVPFVPTTAVASANTKTAVMLPTPEVGAFEFCAAIDRNQQRHFVLLNRFFQSNAFKIKAVLRKHPTVDGKFFAYLHVPADVAYANKNCKLESFTHIRVLLKLADQQAVHRFRGMVVDNAQDTRMEVILVIEEEAVIDFDKHLPPEGGFTTEEFLASVECIDDPTPTRRWMTAIRAMHKDHSRKKGIDTKHIVLQSPPTIVDTGFMASEAGANPQCQVIIDRIVEERQLAPTHIEAVSLACTTQTGLATIQGLLGTGKTRLLGAVCEIQFEVGKQIKRRRRGLAVAPSNLAVEQLAESMIGGDSQKMECVWYMGSCLANEKEEELKGPEDLEAAMRPLWLVVEEAAIGSFDSVLADIGFHKKRLAAFRRWADTLEHPMATKAQVYLDMRTKVQVAQPQDASHKEESNILHMLEEECSAYYLQTEVDMVFCTNEKSAQGLLGKYYRPSFILQDNAAEINVPEAATPVAAFIESVELLVQAGDRTQQRPKPASQGFNEHLGMLLKSPMDLISVNGLFERTCIEL